MKNETEETETKRKSRNIVIHVEELMDTDPNVKNKDHKYVEDVIMKPMGLTSGPKRLY